MTFLAKLFRAVGDGVDDMQVDDDTAPFVFDTYTITLIALAFVSTAIDDFSVAVIFYAKALADGTLCSYRLLYGLYCRAYDQL
jgi:hypothetical protein